MLSGKVVRSRSSCREKWMHRIVLCCGMLKDLVQCEETLCQKRNSVSPVWTCMNYMWHLCLLHLLCKHKCMWYVHDTVDIYYNVPKKVKFSTVPCFCKQRSHNFGWLQLPCNLISLSPECSNLAPNTSATLLKWATVQ